MKRALRSLQARLAAQLSLVFLTATVLGTALFMLQAQLTVNRLADRALDHRAADLVRYVRLDERGQPYLELPWELAAAYRSPLAEYLFVVRHPDGTLVEASHDFFARRVARWSASVEEMEYFDIRVRDRQRDYYGLTRRMETVAGDLLITVAQSTQDAEALLELVLQEFLQELAWTIPVFAVLTLFVVLLTLRQGLKPLRQLSTQATTITPGRLDIRLPEAGLASELLPLVQAINLALDRLESGFAAQRRFTADAAHQLRTPLAVLTTRIEALAEQNGQAQALQEDLARLNRLVQQLLRVARLDALALSGVTTTFDLRAVAEQVVTQMAPLALDQGREIALGGSEMPVLVRGDPDAVAEALINLVENALHHTPRATEVLVEVESEGSVRVTDRGPGVPAQQRASIFQRFWRGSQRTYTGAGLGLAIVAETAKAHGGRVEVGDQPGGGASFTLYLCPASIRSGTHFDPS